MASVKIVLKIEVGVTENQAIRWFLGALQTLRRIVGIGDHCPVPEWVYEPTRMVRLARCPAVRVMLSSVYRAEIWTSMSVGRCYQWGVVMREESVVEDVLRDCRGP